VEVALWNQRNLRFWLDLEVLEDIGGKILRGLSFGLRLFMRIQGKCAGIRLAYFSSILNRNQTERAVSEGSVTAHSITGSLFSP
jgi:hypothetical protein